MKLLIILLLCSNSVLSEGFDTEPQAIVTINVPDNYKKVIYNNKYTLSIPEDFNIKQIEGLGKKVFGVRSSSDKAVIMIDEVLATNKILFNPERYGLNGYSRRQLVSAIFDKNYITNDEVNETRKLIFESLKNIIVYKRDGFLIIREDKKGSANIKTLFTILSPKDDEIITMNFLVNDENLMMNVIKSFKVK